MNAGLAHPAGLQGPHRTRAQRAYGRGSREDARAHRECLQHLVPWPRSWPALPPSPATHRAVWTVGRDVTAGRAEEGASAARPAGHDVVVLSATAIRPAGEVVVRAHRVSAATCGACCCCAPANLSRRRPSVAGFASTLVGPCPASRICRRQSSSRFLPPVGRVPVIADRQMLQPGDGQVETRFAELAPHSDT
jgi:hypothetical protein